MVEKAKWTFMVYLAGDNSLSTAGDMDLGEMRAVGSTDDVNVVVEFDNAGERGTVRYHIQRESVGEDAMSLGETDSGSPEVLHDFVHWTVGNYPAERYGLILWSHACGWPPLEVDRVARGVRARDYNVREVKERSTSSLGKVFFRSTLETILARPSSEERAICCDDGSGHSLDTVELGKVLRKIKDVLGQPLDLLGMDACLMSNLEVAYQAHPYVNYLVASEESEPADGWPYDAVLNKLVGEPDLTPAEFAAHIVEVYVQSYAGRDYRGPVTQTALDLSRMDGAVEALDTLASALTAHMPEAAGEVWEGQRRSARFWRNTLWDIGHFCEELERLTAGDAVRRAAGDVRVSLAAGSGNFVIAEAHAGEKVARCAGVSVYLVPPLMDISPYYGDVEYAKDHGWLAMLQAYHAA